VIRTMSGVVGGASGGEGFGMTILEGEEGTVEAVEMAGVKRTDGVGTATEIAEICATRLGAALGHHRDSNSGLRRCHRWRTSSGSSLNQRFAVDLGNSLVEKSSAFSRLVLDGYMLVSRAASQSAAFSAAVGSPVNIYARRY